jgi:oligopeptidase B
VSADLDDDPAVPPVAPRRPKAITVHGDTRIDDWYWVRDRDDPAVMELLEAENAYTRAATAHLQTLIDDLYGTMLARIQLTDVTYPAPRGDWAYYQRTIEGREHTVGCRRPVVASLPVADPSVHDPDEVVLLDGNEMAEGFSYFAIGSTALSNDQRLLAYAVDTSGGERQTLRIRDIEAGKDLADVIDDVYYGLAFAGDETLFYCRPDHAMRPYQIWRHRLGTTVGDDELVWEEEDERYFLGVGTSKDGRYVMMRTGNHVTSEWRILPTDRPDSEPVVVEPRRQGVSYSVGHHRGELLVLSNDGAENFALWRTPVETPGRDHWRRLLPHRADVRLESVDVIDGYALVEERGHATTAIRLVPLGSAGSEGGAGGEGGAGAEGGAGGEGRAEDGELPGTVIEAPAAGVVMLAHNLGFTTGEVRYETTTLIQPVTLHSYDLETGAVTVLHRQPAPGHDPERYHTERRWATSTDGTQVPVTLAWAKDRPPGPGPCLLYGYGSYEISIDPTYRTDRPIQPLLDHGLVYAIAHVRGGGELGRHWYLEGKLAKKPHSFEDFVSVARYLVDEDWTSPSQLAALGGSAGGLLMGAAANLAPELFAGIVAEVPFVDCLTTMLDVTLPLTVTEQDEWGDPIADEDAYRLIKSYSPYDNVRNERYPRLLVTSGVNDPRVGYFEPTKWVQKLRAAHPDNATRVLLRMELSAGHSGPSGRYQAWKKRAFVFAFILETVGALTALEAYEAYEAYGA